MDDFVHDDEILFRRVENDKKNFYIHEDGVTRVTYSAFSDSSKQISVDRAELCNHNPSHTQKRPENGVVQLTAGEVRVIGNIEHGETKNPYEFDVIPDPIIGHPQLEDNLAHALIWPDPEKLSKGAYTKLRHALAFIASWLILPEGAREEA